MASENQALRDLLTSKSAITDLVGNDISANKRRKNGSLPAITYRTVSNPREYDYDGQTELIDRSFDLHMYAKSKADLDELISTVETEIKEESGTFGGMQIDYVMVTSGGADDYIDDLEIYTDLMEVMITFDR